MATKYALILKGGSIGESRNRSIDVFDTKEAAQASGKGYVKSFSGGSRNYYKPGYSVKAIESKSDIWDLPKINIQGIEYLVSLRNR